MPEYLAPGVYVEEVDTGSKPIEGVSTSTAGMVGVTERGPVNVPILVTSVGNYSRTFGGRLDIDEFSDGGRTHGYLAHSVEGFFTNGGKRTYITRVLPAGVGVRDPIHAYGLGVSDLSLFDRGNAGMDTLLLLGANEGTGTAVAPPLVRVVDGTTGLTVNDFIRIGDGSRAEYRQAVQVNPVAASANEASLALAVPTYENYAQGSTISTVDMLDDDTSVDDLTPSTTSFRLANIEGLASGIQIHVNGEVAIIQDVDADTGIITLAAPLGAAPVNGSQVTLVSKQWTVDDPGATATATAFTLSSLVGVNTGMAINVNSELVVIQDVEAATQVITVAPALGAVPSDGDVVTSNSKLLSGAEFAGASKLSLDNRVTVNAGDVLRIGIQPDEEYVTVANVLGERGAAPDAGDVVLTAPLGQAYSEATVVRRQHPPQTNGAQLDATLILPSGDNADTLYAATADAYAANDIFRIILASGATHYHRLAGNAVQLVSMADIEINDPLQYNHELGQAVVEREPLFDVVALDPGAWGNRLRISVEDEEINLATDTEVTEAVIASQLRLASVTGVEAGSILELYDPATGNTIGPLVKVREVDRADNNRVTLDGSMLNGAQIAAPTLHARSREFRLTVRLLRRPDPAVPSRNNTVIDSELFRHLSMDPRHSRCIEKVIGVTWDPLNAIDDNGNPLRRSDRRSEGESVYIRVNDLAPDAVTSESVRLGPETLVDLLPGGQERAARHLLQGGDDVVASMNDAMYQGEDHVEPENRTGLFSLRNIEQISLVSCPGQTTAAVQQALIDHCELMRYRFAVLDGPGPRNDTLTDVQNQRQQFDTKYAALYHPWLQIPDPMPDNLASIAQVALPPSGHILGVYARTDIERGVHKAPANEIVRGITGLTRQLNKGEHDILNPFPVNINVIRDFRPNNRGIRVWGARCITSDPDYKYVNVRRLMIFLEHSIDRGLQWVVFEPNAEPLWARVTRSIANFLTVVWRNHALEGTTPEQGFFVKCDRTTMTQTDIDNGRLICVIGVAPVKPAEFVIIRIGLWTGNADQQ